MFEDLVMAGEVNERVEKKVKTGGVVVKDEWR